MKAGTALCTIKLVHTVVWAFFAGCIVSIPVAAHLGHFKLAAALIGAVLFEIFVLLINRWSCPLTAIAARYTDNRRDNFDIYLPLWLARHNKLIFGTLFISGLAYTAVKWLRHLDAT